MFEKILEVTNLTKKYKNNIVVDHVSFDIKKGSVVGLLGTNGAGKSTIINMLSTILKIDDGNIFFEGKDIKNQMSYYKRNLGVVPQEIAIYEQISVIDNARYFCKLYNIPNKEIEQRCEKILKAVDLYEVRNRKPGEFSGGMKRRLNIALALLHQPKLVIFDEPTVGVDIQSRKLILDYIKKLKQENISVIYTSHYMEEVEEIADNIIVIKNGHIIANGNSNDIRSMLSENVHLVIKIYGFTNEVKKDLVNNKNIYDIYIDNDLLHIILEKEISEVIYYEIIDILRKYNCKIREINTIKENLETVFLNITAERKLV